jgi:hypothetical protein
MSAASTNRDHREAWETIVGFRRAIGEAQRIAEFWRNRALSTTGTTPLGVSADR